MAKLQPTNDKAWNKKDDSAKVVEYIQRVKHDYYEADAFKKYKKRCERTKYLVAQLWENGQKNTKFGFRLGMLRAARDNYRDGLHDLFDLDEWVYLTPLQDGDQAEQYCTDLQGFINNMLRQIGYKKMWYRRLDYLPDYGWSPAYGDFQYSEGYKLKAADQAEGGLPFDASWDTVLSRPVSRALHPYAWFGSPSHAYDFPYQGYMKRWYICDVYQARAKKTKDGKPVYNPEALDKLEAMLAKKQQERDMYMPESRGQDINDQDLRYDQAQKQPYIDVTVFHGSLSGCEGHWDDPAVYSIECTKSLMLRMAEDPLGYWYEAITHAKTHAYRSNPFSQSFLDPIREHQRIGDLLLNLSIENTVDSLHRFWWLNEDDLLDPNDFYNPRGLNTFIQAATAGARPPQLIEPGRSAALQDVQLINQFLDKDRQLVGVTDQEIGLGVQGQNGDTATEAQMLKNANGKKLRATCKRISEEALIPEIKYLALQALLYWTPDQVRMASKGQPVQLTPEHMQAFVTNAEFRVNDHVTRDSDADALKTYNFWMSAIKLSQQLSTPDTAIKIIRQYGKKLGIEELDTILPPPVPPQMATPGMPGMPGQPGMPAVPGAGPIAPPAPAPAQADFSQAQAGQFNPGAPQ